MGLCDKLTPQKQQCSRCNRNPHGLQFTCSAHRGLTYEFSDANASSSENAAMELESDRPSPAKLAAAENAISQAAFIIERIDKKWPDR